jgi:DNA polymerase alpha-associated DNA helicase A
MQVCWIPIFKAKKLILAGDPMQLPPTILSIGNGKKAKAKAGNSASIATSKSTGLKKEVAVKVKPDKPLEKDSGSDSDESKSEEGEESDVDGEEAQIPEPLSSKLKTLTTRRIELLPPRTLETTLFDRLEKMYGPSIKRMLKVQYRFIFFPLFHPLPYTFDRMHAQICAFPSKTLYSSKLQSHSSVAARLLQDLPNTHADSEEDVKDMLQTPVVFFDTAGCEYFERLDGDGDEGSRSNENEVTIVKNWVEKLVSHPSTLCARDSHFVKVEVGIQPNQIAIITPYVEILRAYYCKATEVFIDIKRR